MRRGWGSVLCCLAPASIRTHTRLCCSAAECCSTPYSLIGLTFTVSYLALGVLNLCKFYLLGFGAFQNGNVMHR